MSSVRAETFGGLFQAYPLDPVMAAEIIDVDLDRGVDDALFAAIEAALIRYQVLVFRHQQLSVDAHIAFSRRFGELQVHVLNQYLSENPEVMFVTNLDRDGKPNGHHPDPGAQIWHSDGSWSRIPGKITTLYGIELPASGGDTLFANMYAAYDALSADKQARFAKLRVVHDLDASRRRTSAKDQMTPQQRAAAPPVEHALIRTHPISGRKCLYLGEHASHIAGMDYQEGRQLVERLNAHATQPQFVYRHRWQLYDLLVWDNRCTLHKATDYDYAHERRIVRRTTMLDEVSP